MNEGNFDKPKHLAPEKLDELHSFLRNMHSDNEDEEGEKIKKIKETGEFEIGSTIPAEPVGNSKDFETVEAYVTQTINDAGVIKIEYIGHGTTTEKDGVMHYFYFRSKFKDLVGKVSDKVIFPTEPIAGSKTDGNNGLYKWFLELRKLEIGGKKDDLNKQNISLKKINGKNNLKTVISNIVVW
ncbi:MAG: hypothetical protein KBD52_02360 [Candidatus Pacebacteria bacterium]|nr:hypothetical protein [Candidatus Paceibacterota bacterium]